MIVGYLILIVLMRRGQWKLREASVERSLAIQAGIGGRWPHAKTNNDGGAP
jgi:hypothetical protein